MPFALDRDLADGNSPKRRTWTTPRNLTPGVIFRRVVRPQANRVIDHERRFRRRASPLFTSLNEGEAAFASLTYTTPRGLVSPWRSSHLPDTTVVFEWRLTGNLEWKSSSVADVSSYRRSKGYCGFPRIPTARAT